ncbi:hypothetical protein CesoFtcFv8_018636 [Champsocephalus esox]|uniref:Uncharacterized protein n=1 Tax=Champsocephalus esox TaxID=159716 RepID=A0AAN8GPU7_9TELE|nr:hypothetical protein CesoFtcFv8_018636 [Champsocephalus esox]
MVGRWNLLILALNLSIVIVLSETECPDGFNLYRRKCVDIDECEFDEDNSEGLCGNDAVCHNTFGSFHCSCEDGYRSTSGAANFSAATSVKCEDFNECLEDGGLCGPNASCFNTIPQYSCICEAGFKSTTGVESFRNGDNITCRDMDECQEENVCGQNATCINTQGSFNCVCNAGFKLKSGHQEQCEDICMIGTTICGYGTCYHGASGHYCTCHAGFTNYGHKGSRCTELNCDVFNDKISLTEEFHVARDLVKQLKESCLELTVSENPKELDGEEILKQLLSVIDNLLSGGAFKDNKKVSIFLTMVEETLRFIGPFIKAPWTAITSTHADLKLLVKKGDDFPQGTKTFSTKGAHLNISLKTAAGEPSYYPGFTTVSHLSYANLEDSADGFFSGMKRQEEQSYKINSKVVTVTVSNRNTSHLKEPVILTFDHLKQSNELSHTCVFWDSSKEGGSWSARGCSVLTSNPNYTVCSCNHLSSFAVLMALHEIEDTFELQLITWVGCAVVAGLLHFFFLAAFCWMCLEGIQLFRMVVLVFNTSFKTLYMMAGGYGVPAVIVAVSALANAKGYGTKRHCWLNLELIWSFFGPVCVIIVVNIFFFLITVWKLAQKFSSLNPDLDNLQKIKVFIITAVAQLTLLGTMWIFGCFQFEGAPIVISYLFTIFSSFQGFLLFVMHCLLSKQVREEYGKILSICCAPGKKSYSGLNSSHASKARASKSTQDTGESRI